MYTLKSDKGGGLEGGVDDKIWVQLGCVSTVKLWRETINER